MIVHMREQSDIAVFVRVVELGVWVAGPAAAMIFGELLRRRIAVEERALKNLNI